MAEKKINTVDDISKWRLCVGCGACASFCEEKAITMLDVTERGYRPFTDKSKCKKCGECLSVCPGFSIKHNNEKGDMETNILDKAWGRVIEVWEGYASDEIIRFNGSSGGVATALSLYCLEQMNISGVLHTSSNPQQPWRNIPTYSKSKEELISCCGSRYAPAATCRNLFKINEMERQSVFIGKACDIAALRKMEIARPEFSKKLCLTISIFCAGTPSTQGTLNLLEKLQVKPEEISDLRYRGMGWPGMASTTLKKSDGQKHEMTYREAWDYILTPCVQFGCRICPDHTGELADISCGDPWYREIEKGEPGSSLILVRTETGKKILEEAHNAGYINIVKKSYDILPASQKSILHNRRHLFGRILAMKIMGLPVPDFSDYNLWSNFKDISLVEKFKSIMGTIRRIIVRGMYKPENLDMMQKIED